MHGIFLIPSSMDFQSLKVHHMFNNTQVVDQRKGEMLASSWHVERRTSDDTRAWNLHQERAGPLRQISKGKMTDRHQGFTGGHPAHY